MRLLQKIVIERWDDDLYSEPTPIRAPEENAQMQVSLFDVAYWPEGSGFCFFYGPTPITKNKDMVPSYSPVNVMVKIISLLPHIQDFLRRAGEIYVKKHTPVVLRLG